MGYDNWSQISVLSTQDFLSKHSLQDKLLDKLDGQTFSSLFTCGIRNTDRGKIQITDTILLHKKYNHKSIECDVWKILTEIGDVVIYKRVE